MEHLGTHNNRKVYWWNYSDENYSELPGKDWICFVMADNFPETTSFDKFVKIIIGKAVLEFKVQGNFCELLHDFFDETIVEMEVMESYSEINIVTTWHSKEGFADAFWQCFYATSLPATANYNGIKIVCTHLDGIDKKPELRSLLKKFNEGWIPSGKE
jgi:hypothetical protein